MVSRTTVLIVAVALSLTAFFARRNIPPPPLVVTDSPVASPASWGVERIFTQPATDIASDGEAVWVMIDDGCIVGIFPDGTTKTVAASERVALGIAADSTHVYWGVYTSTGGAIRRVRKTGGEVETVTETSTVPFDLTVKDGTVAYIMISGSLGTAPMTGGTSRVLASLAGPSEILATDGGFVVHSMGDSSIVLVDGVTGATKTLARLPTREHGVLTMDDELLYWSVRDPRDHFDRVMKMKKDGSSEPTVVRSGFDLGTTVAQGSGFIVMKREKTPWDQYDMPLVLIPLDGGQPIDPDAGAALQSHFVTAGGYAYYTMFAAHNVRTKVPNPGVYRLRLGS